MNAPASEPNVLHDQAKRDYKSLLGIFDVGDLEHHTAREILDQHGFPGCEVHYFKTADDNFDVTAYSAAGGDGSVGGGTNVVRTPGGDYRTLVIMRRVTTGEVSAEINDALFLHELGHVDDFERGVHMVVGQRLDVEAAELYAHRFACRQMRERKKMFSLTFYLADVLASLQSIERNSKRC